MAPYPAAYRLRSPEFLDNLVADPMANHCPVAILVLLPFPDMMLRLIQSHHSRHSSAVVKRRTMQEMTNQNHNHRWKTSIRLSSSLRSPKASIRACGIKLRLSIKYWQLHLLHTSDSNWFSAATVSLQRNRATLAMKLSDELPKTRLNSRRLSSVPVWTSLATIS